MLVVVIVGKHLTENKISLRQNVGKFALQGSLAAVAVLIPLAGFYDRGLQGIYGLQQGAGLHIVKVTYPVSGAGRGELGSQRFRFDPGWGE
ncbi:MAG: hypothetical protein E5V99_26335 [Mesorhizobium sp.]|nr:MAG: hypothetical protein E5V99_26335 [Mesorhizobium sp.]